MLEVDGLPACLLGFQTEESADRITFHTSGGARSKTRASTRALALAITLPIILVAISTATRSRRGGGSSRSTRWSASRSRSRSRRRPMALALWCSSIALRFHMGETSGQQHSLPTPAWWWVVGGGGGASKQASKPSARQILGGTRASGGEVTHLLEGRLRWIAGAGSEMKPYQPSGMAEMVQSPAAERASSPESGEDGFDS